MLYVYEKNALYVYTLIYNVRLAKTVQFLKTVGKAFIRFSRKVALLLEHISRVKSERSLLEHVRVNTVGDR